VGARGEDLAAKHMCGVGFTILARNARTRGGEIDLIAFDGGTLAFVEVKTRLVRGRGRAPRADQQPLSGLGTRQRRRLRRLAAAWLREERRRPDAETIRFDAIGVMLDSDGAPRRIDHVQDAF
jgi:putative endonuclease